MLNRYFVSQMACKHMRENNLDQSAKSLPYCVQRIDRYIKTLNFFVIVPTLRNMGELNSHSEGVRKVPRFKGMYFIKASLPKTYQPMSHEFKTSKIGQEVIDRELLMELIDRCGTPIFVKNRNHTILFVNQAMSEFVGLPAEQMIGKSDYELYSPEEAEEFAASDESAFESCEKIEYDEVITTKHGDERIIRTIKNIFVTKNNVELLVGTLSDLTELRKAQGRLEDVNKHLSVIATTDALTGLSNRSQFEASVQEQINESKESKAPFSIIFIDLNGFKVINDTAGHLVGDEILRVCGHRLANCFRKNTCLARVGGDEFLVLLRDTDEYDVVEVVDRLFDSFNDPIKVNESSWQIGCSVGVAVFPKDGTGVSELIRNSDFAMYEAKKQKSILASKNKSSVEFFRARIGKSMDRKLQIECALNFRENFSAIQQHYQPIVSQGPDLKYKIVGFESLARWKLDGKYVSPEEFIPILEKGGAIIPFGFQIVESACQYISKKCTEDQFVSINLTYRQIAETGFCERIAETIQNSGINPRQIALELTEHDANVDCQIAHSILSRLGAIGVRTMIDDFGSGYSNLSRLSELPIDIVKIDKSLLWGNNLLFNSVLQMVKNLGFTTIIEGVETREQLQAIEKNGAEMMQGYFFGRPEPQSHDWSKFEGPNIGRPIDHIIPSSFDNEFANPTLGSNSPNISMMQDPQDNVG